MIDKAAVINEDLVVRQWIPKGSVLLEDAETARKFARAVLKLCPAPIPDMERLCFQLATQPASARHHLAVDGGLGLHSLNVVERLLQLSEHLGIKWDDPRSPYVIGLCHDLCKVHRYHRDGDLKWVKTEERDPGHGMLSAMLAPEYLGRPLRYVERVCIAYHMGAWGIGKEYEAKHLDAAVSEFPLEVIATHTADMLASQYDEVGK